MLKVDATIAAIPSGIGRLSKLSNLQIGVRELSRKDIRILQNLAALNSLSVDVKTTPTKCIVFGKRGFLALNFFMFKCSAPILLIEESAMPKIEKLKLCLNAHEAPPEDGKKPVTIEHLASLKEIYVEIWGTVSDKGSALTNAVTTDARNPIPIVQLMESREDEELGSQEQPYKIIEEDENKEAAIRYKYLLLFYFRIKYLLHFVYYSICFKILQVFSFFFDQNINT